MYTSSDASGTALTGTPVFSSENQDVEGVDAAKAFDGAGDTNWQANGMDSGEYIGVQLAEAQEVRSIKLQQKDEQQGIKQGVLEKSLNCETWARVAEFPELNLAYGNLATYTFSSVDKVPSGVFQIRSRVDINMCIGVEPDESELQDIADGIPQKIITPGNALQIQMCNVDVLGQFWSFDDQERLVNAANDATTMQVTLDDAGALSDEAPVILQTCEDGCPDIKSSFKYNEGSGDGLLFNTEATNLVLAPAGGSLTEGTGLVTATCSEDGTDAAIDLCADKTFAQWDVPPMFTIETGKKAINCAPYSHSKESAIPADDRLTAQKACAANPKCSVYMWADGNTGEDANKGWLCEALDIVYAGKQGYELGFRVRGS
jgi:hypothetical protein